MKILITGGLGYIGSHTAIQFINAGHEILIVDNLSNSKLDVYKSIKSITKTDFSFEELDLCETKALISVFSSFLPDAVIHFAGLKAVGESVEDPIKYYDNNVGGSISLLKAMEHSGCHKILFSSSATVYGVPEYLPFDEQHRLDPINPYGQSKLMTELVLKDWAKSKETNQAIILRYFNPVGAHKSGFIGEDPLGVPNNLMPFISQVASGRLEELKVFGSDYDTRDGTGERDYIHVEDLSRAHLLSLNNINKIDSIDYFNVGTGSGYTVLECIKAYEKESGKNIKYTLAARRDGDVSISYASANKIKEFCDWSPEFDLEAMCKDSWNWECKTSI